MLDDRITELSDVQKQCLRLAAGGRSSKEIAPLVGLTHRTVDQYLHRALQTLGATNRRDAARMLVEIESAIPFKEFQLKPSDVAKAEIAGTSEAPTEQAQRPAGLLGLPPIGGPPNDLNRVQRLVAIGKIALLLMICVLAMVLLVKGAFVALA